jgi:guanylate kinase
MHIAVDFDGTIVEQEYPNIGNFLPNSKYVINYLYNRGHTILINTCRANSHAENAKNYLIQKGFLFDFFNENDEKLIERYGTDTRKVSADVYIDDKNLNDLALKTIVGIDGYNEMLWGVALEQFERIEKPIILCIIGESGSGKSLIADYLYNQYDINLIESYTDRERRYDEEGGHTFLSTKEYDNLQGTKLAETVFGSNRYCCLVEDLMHCNTYVIDENGLQQLKDKWQDDFDIISLRIVRPDFDRLESVGQERFDRDKGKFNMKLSEFDYVIVNDDNRKEFLIKKVNEFMKLFRLDGRAQEYIPWLIELNVNDL